jgi:uncharacterized membrane protein
MTQPDTPPPTLPPTSAWRNVSRRAAVSFVAVSFIAALALMATLRPDTPTTPSRVDAAQSGTITAILTSSTTGTGPVTIAVELRGDGPVGQAGTTVTVETWDDAQPRLTVGDQIKVITTRIPTVNPDGTWGETSAYQLIDFDRSNTLWLLAILFAIAVIAVGGWQGVRSLAGLATTLAIIIGFVVPAILTGHPPALVALAAGCVIMTVTLYASHGTGPHVTAAAVGTLTALAATTAIGVWFINTGQITGLANEHAYAASVAAGGIDLTGLVLAGLIIATLGVLDDVTVSQAATVWALHTTDPTQPRRHLFTAAMAVGRDHIAAVVNTLFLAYTGASLALLVLFHTSGLPAGEIVASEAVAEELIKTLVGSIGLILAVPLTTALAAALATGAAPGPRSPDHHTQLHGVAHSGEQTGGVGHDGTRHIHPRRRLDPFQPG